MVHVELVDVGPACGFTAWALHIVDAASRFHAVRLLDNKSSAAVIDALEDIWLSWAGPPVTMVVDVGPEFVSDEFADWQETHGIAPYVIPIEAPHQNGAVEIQGGILKMRLAKICAEHSVTDRAGLKSALSAARYAGNSEIDDSGFSPMQWVLGRQPRMPAD